MLKTSLPFQVNQVACPKCGQPTAVEQADGAYHCLSCGFHNDLVALDEGSIFGVFSAAVCATLLVIALI